MIKKDTYYGQAGGDLDPNLTVSDFNSAEGIMRNRVALAQHVNTYHQMSDRDLLVVCQEIQNLLGHFGIEPNEDDINHANMNQLATMFENNVPGPYALTGVVRSSISTMPSQNGATINIPQMEIVYNLDVFYGNTQARLQRTTLAAQTITASNWENGVHYIYATTTASSTTSTIGHQQAPVKAEDGATKCMLGSCFVIDGAIQDGSWKFQPWLQVTSVEERQVPTARTKGGFVSPYSATGGATMQLQMGAMQILDEGINFGANPNSPSIMSINAVAPFTYKFLYPLYNPSAEAETNLDTTHIYNITSGTWDDISDLAELPQPRYIVMVPCVTPTGQTLMIPAMSTKTGETYNQVFATQEEASAAIYSLPYAAGLDQYAARAIYMGQSIIVKVGATDLTDPLQYMAVGMIPQELAGFTTASGQSGGGTGQYIPMPEINWSAQIDAGTYSLTMQNNAANVVSGSANQPISINPPSPQNGIINQFEVKYTHTSGSQGISWNSGFKWWSNPPSLIDGNVYNIIFEYVNGYWIGGVLSAAV